MQKVFLGDTPFKTASIDVEGGFTELLGESFYRIRGYDAMEPFFMSLVSSSDHWLFLSSSGGLTAGRTNAEQALFPYYTEDKLSENRENTGCKTILFAVRGEQKKRWEPFSDCQRGVYEIRRSIYKNTAGTAVVFEEENLDLDLMFRYAWRTGETFGFIRTAWLENTGAGACRVELLDGLQNILPANVGSHTQNVFSVLLDAYKRAELHGETGMALFSLSSTLSDLPEPSESLLATTTAQFGLRPLSHLLSSTQLNRFRSGLSIVPETDIRGRRGAYFVHATLDLERAEKHTWYLIADVCQDHADVARLARKLQTHTDDLVREVEADIDRNVRDLFALIGAADGLQVSADSLVTAHHGSNTLFNIMRGGIFPDQYRVKPADLLKHLRTRNHSAHGEMREILEALSEPLPFWDLQQRIEEQGSPATAAACRTYLPLTFSRRHGDPSRPWNRFSIQVKNPDGTRRYAYEGNWRDIFQNWEALALAFPEYIENMLGTFLNATTVDGYNPYRLTHAGLDWEKPDPDNPWANIGYWNDHQIIYLLRLMEASRQMHPARLDADLNRPLFAYAHVPYRIKPYEDVVRDPYRTIDFDWELDREIERQVALRGTDAKLVSSPGGQILRVNLVEKLLSLLLAKLVNFVPEGGIWMNTQRPEWNDANNALVGKGLSVVTLGHLRRYVVFLRELLSTGLEGPAEIAAELATFFNQVATVFSDMLPLTRGTCTDVQRREMMDRLGNAGSAFRWKFYQAGLSGGRAALEPSQLLAFLETVQTHLEHDLRANRMENGLYHSYNTLELGAGTAAIRRLELMLEGQVALLSSGLLTGDEALLLVQRLRASALYRADQQSYLLYPDRDLPGFLGKNRIPAGPAQALRLFAVLLEAGDRSLVTRDISGEFHFSGRFRNERDVQQALAELGERPEYSALVAEEAGQVVELFERVFDHARFTGRAGTFFAYEGLGSIYWHMVAKLLLAVQENAVHHRGTGAGDDLIEAYREIRAGLGFNKSPRVFGAFPFDPYSHTPSGKGAQQPGMTGLVKEMILARQAELGLFIRDGRIVFDFLLFDKAELLPAQADFRYPDVSGREQTLVLEPGSLALTCCQVPIVIRAAPEESITVVRKEDSLRLEGLTLDARHSRHIMQRDGVVVRLEVGFRC